MKLKKNYSRERLISLQDMVESRSTELVEPLNANDSQFSVKTSQSEFKPQDQQPGFWNKMLIFLGLKPSPPKARTIHFNGQSEPNIQTENVVKNQKYSIITFVPIVLFNQFKQFQNLFFLLTAVSQFFPILQVGGMLFSFLAPLVLVLFLTMLKEGYDDFQRYRRDREANEKKYPALRNGQFVDTKSCDFKVGDIVQISANQRIPADIVLLWTQDANGQVFIRTDQLDGETDWKLRKSIKLIQQNFTTQESLNRLQDLDAWIEATKPILDIYDFTGVYKINMEGGEQKSESLKLENALWANTVLASGKIAGMVIYTGRETRMAMNSRQPRTKFGRLDNEVNFLAKLLFVMMLALSIVLVILDGQTFSWYIIVQLIRYLILLSAIIPISMRVNLDFAKLIYCFKINKDQDIEGTIARNSTIPEELGRIQYLLTDKTGTLTQNDMIFKRLSLENINYTEEDIPEISSKLKEQCEKGIVDGKNLGPIPDIVQILQKQKERKSKKRVQIRRNPDLILRDLITALSICHNVTPMINDDGEKEFQASSPDEVALVKTSEHFGMELNSRDAENLLITNAAGKEEDYHILNIFPFSSETKRMGIVVKHKETGKIIFYLKGADAIMKQFLPETQRGFVDEECDDLAREGLRTLVITQKYIDSEWYSQWEKKYKQADELLEGRNEAIRKVVAELEGDMEFLGITGVEDKLQENICQSLENVRNAGINIWMLTGDKIETAICISISSGLKAPEQNIYVIKEAGEIELQAKLIHFKNLSSNYILVIDGQSLKCAMENYKQLFLEVSTKAPAVVCCRCSPTQKSEVVESIKKYTKKITAAIGDGGNDVGMITSADVGIGIVGKEGMQAALAADFSIKKFCYLDKLLLWHGRLSYKRSALLAQFIMHRGMLISFIQAIFTSIYYFVALSIFNGLLLLGYSTIFTMLPAFALIFDTDVDVQTALKYPPLYQTLQRGRELNSKTFCVWVWKALFQGSVIMLLSMLLFPNSYLLIETITFTAMIFTEYLLSLSELNRLHIITIIANAVSILLYILILTTMRTFFEIQNIMQVDSLLKILIIVLVAWLPLFMFQLIKKKVDPSDYEKIMKTVKIKAIGMEILK